MSANGSKQYLTLADVYARYNGAYSLWTLRERARCGEIPHLKHAGTKALLFREDWLNLWDGGAELERRTIRRRGVSPGRVVQPVSRQSA